MNTTSETVTALAARVLALFDAEPGLTLSGGEIAQRLNRRMAPYLLLEVLCDTGLLLNERGVYRAVCARVNLHGVPDELRPY